MRKKTVLCEVAFWKKFSECYPSLMPFPDEKAIENLKSWMELYSFLFRSDVHFDCSDKQFIELAKADQRLWYLSSINQTETAVLCWQVVIAVRQGRHRSCTWHFGGCFHKNNKTLSSTRYGSQTGLLSRIKHEPI